MKGRCTVQCNACMKCWEGELFPNDDVRKSKKEYGMCIASSDNNESHGMFTPNRAER